MTVCSTTDTLCICTTGQKQFASLVSPCVEAACDSTDQTSASLFSILAFPTPQTVTDGVLFTGTEAAAVQLCQAAESSASAAGSIIPTATTASVQSTSTKIKATGSPTTSTMNSKSTSAAMTILAPVGAFGSVVGIAVACMIVL